MQQLNVLFITLRLLTITQMANTNDPKDQIPTFWKQTRGILVSFSWTIRRYSLPMDRQTDRQEVQNLPMNQEDRPGTSNTHQRKTQRRANTLYKSKYTLH